MLIWLLVITLSQAFMLICYISAHEAAMKELERIFGEAGGHYDTVCEEVHAPPLPSYHPSTTTPCARRCAPLRYLVITPPLRHRVRGSAHPSVT